MYKHWWCIKDAGMAIECDKCGRYVNLWYGDNRNFDENTEDCSIPDEDMGEL